MTRKSKKQIQNQAQAGYMQSNEPQIAGGEAGKQNKIKMQSQDGQSMVEMLGVLAVIAVLSIGGIVGYKLAMNHYQASQIAHEMNMMRTDAQIKIAQGTENLTLGSPYDEHKINFNGYETAFGCKYVNEDDIISEETVSCQIANAYFIELPKIPNGVCQPLIRLINGMDNLIAFSVNDSEYEEGGVCQEGENDLYAVFSGETVSDLTRCERDDDCKELESTPFCDETRHVCVECTEEKGCEGESEYCEDNVCKTCESGVWGGQDKGCVECTENSDCENPTTPYCNPTSNRCEPCENDSQCDTAQKEHCKTSKGECVVCEDGAEWDTETEACMSCSNRECTDNSDCCENYFCRKGLAPLPDGDNIVEINKTAHSNSRGTCEPLGEAKPISLNGNQTFYGSDKFLVWWDGCRWCEALNKESGSQCDSNTYESNYMVDVNDIDWQCSGIGNFTSSQREVYCCYADGAEKNPQGSPSSYYGEMVCDANKEKSSTIKRLRELYSDQDVYIWFKNYFRGADSWRIAFANLYQGYISNNGGARYDDKNAGRARTICK